MRTRTPDPDPVDTIEGFAELVAALDDPFAEEAEVLRAAGLDEESWEAIVKRWMDQAALANPTDDLAARFAKIYAEARQRQATGSAAEPAPDTEPTDTGFLSAEAQPWRAEAAMVGRDIALEPLPRAASVHPPTPVDTVECPVWRPRPALPFHSAATPSHAAADATLEPGAHLPLPALPFGPAH